MLYIKYILLFFLKITQTQKDDISRCQLTNQRITN